MDFKKHLCELDSEIVVDLNGKYFIPFSLYYLSKVSEDFSLKFSERGEHSFTKEILEEYSLHWNISKFISDEISDEIYLLPTFGILDTKEDVLDLYYLVSPTVTFKFITYRNEVVEISSFDSVYVWDEDFDLNEVEFYSRNGITKYEKRQTYMKLMRLVQRGVLSFEYN